jgi:hypothetical protein
LNGRITHFPKQVAIDPRKNILTLIFDFKKVEPCKLSEVKKLIVPKRQEFERFMGPDEQGPILYL